MARKDYSGRVEDILPIIIEDQVKTNQGSLRFLKKDKKTYGKLFFRNGMIYGIDLSTYKPNIVNRIITNEHIKDSARDMILERYQNNLSDLSVVQLVLTAQLFPEKVLLIYIKDYFLDAFDELLSWDQATAEWKQGDTPQTPTTVPNTNPFDLITKARRRRDYLETKLAPVWNSTIKQMELLGFRRNFKFKSDDYTTSVLLEIADSTWTIGGAAEYLGMSRFNVKKTLFELWREGIIDVVHPSGLLITNRSKESLTSKVSLPQNISAISSDKDLELMPGEIVEQVVSPAPQPIQASEPYVQVSEPQTFASQPLQVSEPYVQASEPIVANPSQPQLGSPIPPPQQPLRNEQMTDPAFTQSPAQGSRLALITQQLKEELANAEQMIIANTERKNTLIEYHSRLQDERGALIQQLQSVDSRLASNSNDITQVDGEINRLVSERSETTRMLQG